MARVLRTLLAPCIALTLAARASCAPPAPSLQNEGRREANNEGHTNRQTTHAARNETLPRVQRLVEAAGSDVFHLDLNSLSSGGEPSGDSGAQGESRRAQTPWFEGFVTSGSEAAVAAVTVGHPIRRMLSYFHEEAIELDALFGVEDEGSTVNPSTSYPRDYQLVDNYLVRVLAGKSAWELPPGGVGAAELTAARIVLGKFEVILREECLSADVSLLMPYLEAAKAAAEMSSWDGKGFPESQELSLPPGLAGRRLVRANWWDLQLWDFANRLVMSRSTTAKSYLCGTTRRERTQNTLGAGRRAVVYNSPNFHLTSVSMFSCVLMSWGYQVTAVLKKPVEGFRQLLPCAHDVIALHVPEVASDETGRRSERIALNSTVEERLGLSLSAQPDNRGVEFGGDKTGGRGAAAGSEGTGPFDVSVLCTAYLDLWALFSPGQNELDARLAGPLMWNVNVSIWNIHGVSRGFEDGGLPPASHDFAAGFPSSGGKKPPPTFLTVYGEQVEKWETLLEEAYEGWGPKPINQEGHRRKKESSLRGLFPHPGVVYPILPTGGMRVPRPTPGFASSENGGSSSGGDGTKTLGETRRVRFVVQGIMVSTRRDYKTLLACLEAMCVDGRDNFSLDAVGSSGDLTAELQAHPCVASRFTEGLHLDYNDFYARITQSDFVVTAAAVDDYEYDRATSSVPTALLLEKPLVMASSLLHAYPCLWNSRIHSMVADDDLCFNLQAAYDLTPSEYDEMELEARDCKLAMWKQTRETVAELVLKGRVSSYS